MGERGYYRVEKQVDKQYCVTCSIHEVCILLLTSDLVKITNTISNSTCQIVVEKRLKKLARDFQDGKHEGSMISSVTVDSLTQDDQETWREIRKEFENIGISVAAFEANKSFIMQWFESAISSGAFMEGYDPEDTKSETESVRSITLLDEPTATRFALTANPPREDRSTTSIVPAKSQPQTIGSDRHGGKSNDLRLPQNLPSSISTTIIAPIDEVPSKKVPRIVSLFSWAVNQEKSFRNALSTSPKNYAKARRCLDNGVDINVEIFKDHHLMPLPETALFHFARIGDLPTLKWILEQGINPGNTPPNRDKYNTGSVLPKVLSQKYGHGPNFEVAQMLLDYGAEIDGIGCIYSDCLHSALHAAVIHKKIGVVQWLLDRGANPRLQESRRFDSNINRSIADAPDETIFHTAARVGNLDTLQLLLDKGVDVDILNALSQSALIAAVQCCMSGTICITGTITWLLDHGANVNLIDSVNGSPLYYAAFKNQRSNAARLLIQRGASIDYIEVLYRMSAVRYALNNSYDDIALLFLATHKDMGEIDSLGNTLLHAAALGACLKSYKRLIALGLSPHAINNRGEKPYRAAQDFFERGFFGGRDVSDIQRKLRASQLRTFLLNANLGVNHPNTIVS